MRSRSDTTQRRATSTGFTVASLIIALALLALGVFALAGRARAAGDASLRLHAVDDAQQHAIDVENQLRLLVVANGLDETFEEVAVSVLDNGAVLVAEGLAGLEGALTVAELGSTLDAEVQAFSAAARSTLDAAASRDLSETDRRLTQELAPRAAEIRSALMAERTDLINEIDAANAILTALRTFTTFVVVYLVPTAGLLAYRSLKAVPLRERRLRARLSTQERHADDTSVALGAVVESAHQRLIDARRQLETNSTSPEALIAVESAEHQLHRSAELIAATGRRSSSSYTDVDLVAVTTEVAQAHAISATSRIMRALVRADLRKLELILREMIDDAVSIAGPTGVGVTVLTRGHEAIVTVSHRSDDDVSNTLGVVFDQGSAAIRQLASRHGARGSLLLAQTIAESMGASLAHERVEDADHISLVLPLERRAVITESGTGRTIGQPNEAVAARP